ncbi:hypothetical protein NDU88_007532 [Pleurodeles waltl]|uniref:Uncharacterized protein n=1 Tax=Pleurodeles waltl TaxID=8319 RepID=A0AAV7VSK5_PLEWA|nr:hypothetical protein NDU88_007532 [Pleurodeles waltl]
MRAPYLLDGVSRPALPGVREKKRRTPGSAGVGKNGVWASQNGASQAEAKNRLNPICAIFLGRPDAIHMTPVLAKTGVMPPCPMAMPRGLMSPGHGHWA